LSVSLQTAQCRRALTLPTRSHTMGAPGCSADWPCDRFCGSAPARSGPAQPDRTVFVMGGAITASATQRRRLSSICSIPKPPKRCFPRPSRSHFCRSYSTGLSILLRSPVTCQQSCLARDHLRECLSLRTHLPSATKHWPRPSSITPRHAPPPAEITHRNGRRNPLMVAVAILPDDAPRRASR